MSLSGKSETTANAATIVVAVLICMVFAKLYLLPKPPLLRQPAAVSASEVGRGTNMDGHLLGVDWTKNHRTLVLAISTTCHFCKDSVPFYRKLGGTDMKMLVVLPQLVPEGEQYLSDAGVHVDGVRQLPLNTLGVRGTPTLLIVNDAGVVTDVWVGKLEPDQETQVLTALGKNLTGG